MQLLTPGRAITLSICVLLQGLAPPAFGAEDVNRPRIGLVLGGGGFFLAKRRGSARGPCRA